MSSKDPSPTSQDYVLDRHLFASMRLTSQHFISVRERGYLVHPSISLKDTDVGVADVGTGTGVWLTDLAGSLPKTARLWGSDIDIRQVPPKEWLPSNMTFEQLDILQDIPKNLENKFDLVHIRLFAFVLHTDEQVSQVLRNVFKMLKPGGWIQWQDADRSFGTALKANPNVDTTASMKLVDILRRDPRIATNPWPDRLGEFFRAAGLQDIETDHYLPGERGTPWLRSSQELIMALFYEIMNRLPPGEVYDGLNENLQTAVKESERGVAYQIRSLLWIGRKPA